jgi:hypothetical protein
MIRGKEVRLVGEKGEQHGVMPLYQAREIAEKTGLDLVEVAPTVVPPVCRLMDYGKYKYILKKNVKLVKGRKYPRYGKSGCVLKLVNMISLPKPAQGANCLRMGTKLK